MKSALAILGETGRTDFTVLEVVERSKTSLRSFYQHFSTKDELLLALIDKIMSESTQRVARGHRRPADAIAALRLLIDRICAPAESTTQDSINRGLTYYNDHLAETLPREYARVLSPLHELIKDIINRGIAEGAFRADLDVDATAALIMQIGPRRHAAARPRRRTQRRPRSTPTTSTSSASAASPSPGTPSDLRDTASMPRQGWCFRWSRRGNVITTYDQSDFQEADMPSRELPYPGVRRRQPLLRAQGSADAVPAGPPQGRHRLHRRPRAAPRSWSATSSATTSPTRRSRWSPDPAPRRSTSGTAAAARASAR